MSIPPDETVAFRDEADLNLKPDIGRMWMHLGRPAEVATPRDNAKLYLGRLAAPAVWRAAERGRVAAQWRPVRRPPGVIVPLAAALPDDPLHLR